MKKKVILFVCKANSGRSQMAEAFYNFLSKNNKAISAGIEPDKKIHPLTIQVMKEVGINLSRKKPELFTNKIAEIVDKIIVMDSELLNSIPVKYLPKVENWDIEKPLGGPIERIRKIRDQIKNKVKQLIK